MRKGPILLLLTILTGCSTVEYKGIPENAFPRHHLNYLFSESFSLDYTPLRASEWRQLSQHSQSAYASTEIIPKIDTADNWQKKYTIQYYPQITVRKVAALDKSVSYIRDRLQNDCREGHIDWKMLENSNDYYIARVDNSGCEKISNQFSVYRLLQTTTGLNVLIYSQKNTLNDAETEEIIGILKEAKVIGYTPAPLVRKNEQTLSY